MPNSRKVFDVEELIKYFQLYMEHERNEVPTILQYTDFQKQNREFPSKEVLLKEFGTWKQSIETAHVYRPAKYINYRLIELKQIVAMYASPFKNGLEWEKFRLRNQHLELPSLNLLTYCFKTLHWSEIKRICTLEKQA
jgi:hypothetical protein